MSVVQAILDGRWRHAKDARAACFEGKWADFVVRTAPPKPGLFGRGAHAACVARAIAMFSGPTEMEFEIVPVWASTNEDEIPTTEWWRAHVLRIGDEPLALAGYGPFDYDADPSTDAHVVGRAQVFDVGHVVLERGYAPGIDLALRKGDFAVLAGTVVGIIEARELAGAPLARPTDSVAPFSQRVVPRVEGLTQEVLRAIATQSFDPEE